MSGLSLGCIGDIRVGQFRAMASPCEIHIETGSGQEADSLLQLGQAEALRIEQLFSRYRNDNIIHEINTARGAAVRVDRETARMLDFADRCFQLSNGLFDITSGVLRRAWRFDGSDNVPGSEAVAQLMPLVGWQKVSWKDPWITLPEGMEIDLGGIGKEYAVDRTLSLLREKVDSPVLVNFGGDLHASAAPHSTGCWLVGIEAADSEGRAARTLEFHRGAMATSGDVRRFLIRDGVRYSHVLNPLTGWPVPDAPSIITVAGNTCIEAGIFSTLGLLQGASAERFLDEQSVTYWCQRS